MLPSHFNGFTASRVRYMRDDSTNSIVYASDVRTIRYNNTDSVTTNSDNNMSYPRPLEMSLLQPGRHWSTSTIQSGSPTNYVVVEDDDAVIPTQSRSRSSQQQVVYAIDNSPHHPASVVEIVEPSNSSSSPERFVVSQPSSTSSRHHARSPIVTYVGGGGGQTDNTSMPRVTYIATDSSGVSSGGGGSYGHQRPFPVVEVIDPGPLSSRSPSRRVEYVMTQPVPRRPRSPVVTFLDDPKPVIHTYIQEPVRNPSPVRTYDTRATSPIPPSPTSDIDIPFPPSSPSPRPVKSVQEYQPAYGPASLRSTSLQGTTLDELMETEMRCVVGIEVNNQTNWRLVSPSVYYRRGTITTPPRDILVGHREAMVAMKRSGCFGTWGTVSWLVDLPDQSARRRVVVMWSDPFNYNHGRNRLAVGLTAPGVIESDDDWTTMMYDGKSTDRLKFVRREYRNDIQQIGIADDMLYVTGNMSTDHRAKVVVDVRPVPPELVSYRQQQPQQQQPMQMTMPQQQLLQQQQQQQPQQQQPLTRSPLRQQQPPTLPQSPQRLPQQQQQQLRQQQFTSPVKST